MSSVSIVNFLQPVAHAGAFLEANQHFVMPTEDDGYNGSHEPMFAEMIKDPKPYIREYGKGDIIALNAAINYYNDKDELMLMRRWLDHHHRYFSHALRKKSLHDFENAILMSQWEQAPVMTVHEISFGAVRTMQIPFLFLNFDQVIEKVKAGTYEKTVPQEAQHANPDSHPTGDGASHAGRDAGTGASQ